METFTPVMSLVGGLMIGTASVLLLLFNGKIAGISGICASVLNKSTDWAWRVAFLVGLLAVGSAAYVAQPEAFAMTIDRSYGALVVAGLLVGFGTRLGGGCTSGHGICGISRFSTRSFVAVPTFIAAGAVTVLLVNVLFGGAL